MDGLSMVAYGAGGVLVLSWLIISFMAQNSGRTVIEWIATTSMYLGSGLAISIAQSLMALGGSKREEASATN